MIRAKQKKLSLMLFAHLRRQFPEIKMVGITKSQEDPSIILLNIIPPKDEKRRLVLYERAGELSADFLDQYGDYILISDASTPEKIPA